LLALLGLPFEAVASQLSEEREPGESPEAYARRLSRDKAQAVTAQIGGPALILAADTIVVDGGEVLGKPRDSAEAIAMLRQLRGRTHMVSTAVTLLDTSDGRWKTEAPVSPVPMRNYTEDEIAEYVASGDPLDKAGAYAIQHEGFHPVTMFRHCLTNVMGLPICEVIRLLREFEVAVPEEAWARIRGYLSEGCLSCRELLRETHWGSVNSLRTR
jgi:MAF protein